MRDQFMHESKNGRWVITKGAFDNVTCAWNVRDQFQKKRFRVTAECVDGETHVSEVAGLPPYVLTLIAKFQAKHQADLLKSVPATAREEN